MTKNEILDALKKLQVNDLDTHGGKLWAYVYDSGLDGLEDAAMSAYRMFASYNGLDFSVFPSLMKMENEIVGNTAALFSDHPEELAGTFTSGGTESIMLAVKSARDFARKHKPEIKDPEMILPVTGHAAFQKAAHYLGLKTVIVPVGADFRVDPEIVRRHITTNTILIVGSAVSYSHGVCDPIDALSKIAVEKDIWLHVDGCIGGYILAYFHELGYEVPKFDFRLPGVRSLSVDLHKYAFAPKGASVILYRNSELRKNQFYTCTTWTGYPLINTTMQSTKSGGPLAACWATLHFIGHEGYKKLFQSIYNTREKILDYLKHSEDLFALGSPDASLLVFSSKTIDVFSLADIMRKKGWYIQVQPGNKQFAPTIHLTITPVSERITDEFFNDLDLSIKEEKEHPQKDDQEGLINQIAKNLAGQTEIDPAMIQKVMQMAGVKADGTLPSKMAEVNELLRILPPEISSEAFLQISSELYSIKKS